MDPSSAPQPLAQARRAGDRARDRRADRRLGPDEDQALLRAGDRRVEQLAREDRRGRRAGAGRRRCRTASPGSCGSSSRRRCRRRRAARARTRRPRRGARRRPRRGRSLACDDDAGVAVVEPQPVVVLGDEQRAAGVPAPAAAKPAIGREPAPRCAPSRSRRRAAPRRWAQSSAEARRAPRARRRASPGAGGVDDARGRRATARVADRRRARRPPRPASASIQVTSSARRGARQRRARASASPARIAVGERRRSPPP